MAATRLPSPWDSPGKNTGVGCHFLLQCIKVKSESEVAQSCRTLSDPVDCSPPGSSVHGIFQARVLEWAAIALSGSWVNNALMSRSEMAAITAIILSKLVSHSPFLFMASLPVAFWSSEHLFGLWLFLFSLGVCTECKCCCGNKRELQSLKTAARLICSINCFNK